VKDGVRFGLVLALVFFSTLMIVGIALGRASHPERRAPDLVFRSRLRFLSQWPLP
jgi:hypothetical protein